MNHNATKFNSAELSKHYVLGLEHLFDNHISLRLEGYYKDTPRINPIYQNLRDPPEVFPEAKNDVVKLNINGRIAKEIEPFLKYDMGKKISWDVRLQLIACLKEGGAYIEKEIDQMVARRNNRATDILRHYLIMNTFKKNVT